MRVDKFDWRVRHFSQPLLDSLTSHIAVLDERGTILAANRAWQILADENSANTPSNIPYCGVGANLLEACGHVDGAWAQFDAPIRALLSGERNQFQFEYSTHGTHGQRWFNARITKFDDDEFARVVVALEETTERKQAQEMQLRLATIVESSQDAIISKTLSGIITTWNKGAEELYGYSAEEAIGQHMDLLLPPDRLHEEAGILEKLQCGEKVLPFETKRVRKDAKLIDVYISSSPLLNAAGEVIGAASLTRDITAQKTAEDESERFFSLSLDLLCIIDETGIFQRVNPACEHILGFAPQELIGQSALEFVHPDDRTASEKALHQLAHGIAVVNHINRWRCRDGSYKSILWNTAPFGRCFYAAGRDISTMQAAEAERAASLALLRATLESTADGILVVNSTGRITHYNQQFVDMWRLPAEILQSGDNDRGVAFVKDQLIHPEEFEQTSYIHSADPERTGFDFLHFKDGRIFERYSQTQQVSGQEAGFVWSFRDVTERENVARQQAQLNQELEQQRQRLDDILATVPGVVWENSIDPITMEQKAVYVSKYCEELLGYSQEEWANSLDFWVRALHPDDRERTLRESAAIVRMGCPGVMRYRLISEEGRVVWTETHWIVVHNEQGQPVGLRGVTMDISDRMEAQVEQSRLAALLEATSDFVGWTNTEGHTQYINPAGRILLGLTPDESVENWPITEFAPDWANEIILNEGLPTASQQGSWSGETALLRRDGREIPVSQVITAHKDSQNHDLFYSTIARDISESKRVQALLEQTNEELEARVAARTEELGQANLELKAEVAERQMAVGALREVVEMLELAKVEAETSREIAEDANRAKSEFLSRMSHELRTPLNVILGFGQILEMRELAPKESAGVEQILKSGRHLLQLINEVLEISRIEAGRHSLSIEPIEAISLLREVTELGLPLAAQRNIALVNETATLSAASEGAYVLADQQRLQQVMLNLLSNAIKYNREGGRVVLSLHRKNSSPNGNADIWRIEVSDTGAGISHENQQKIFMPFERLGAERTRIEGTGIGLTLTKRLVELMKGQIGVESQPGHGSTFWVELPATRNPHTRHQISEESSTLSSLLSVDRSVVVLYIEDNVSNINVMQTLMDHVPQVRLLTAMQGNTGLELARQHRPDIVLLDLHLPDLQGDEVLRQLRHDENTQHIPVVMVSADATQNQINRLLAAGAQRYLTKPLDVKQLIQTLEDFLQTQNDTL